MAMMMPLMLMTTFVNVIFLALILPLSTTTTNLVDAAYGLNQKLLVISFDGFRQLYLTDTLLPWFDHFSKVGVISKQVRSVFPSDTFPNHYSIVTGMYPESHGIVSNSFYDPKLDKSFDFKTNLESYWWDQAEPIWVTARKQGNKRTAVSYWPGSAVKFPPNDYTPDYYREVYDDTVPYETRIDETVDHLANDNVDLAFIYFSEPDSTGHSKGPGSPAVTKQLQMMDWFLYYTMWRLDNAGLGSDKLNMIVCADHGMVNVTTRLYIGNYINVAESVDKIPAYGASMAIIPKPGKTDEIMANLTRGAAESNGKFSVYLKKDVPNELHYSNNDRIAEIMIICSLGVYMSTSPNSQGTASHGFNPKEAPMQPIFMAKGPAFKKGGYNAAQVFENKDLYAIMSYIVGIDPLKTNASLSLAQDLFDDSGSSGTTSPSPTTAPPAPPATAQTPPPTTTIDYYKMCSAAGSSSLLLLSRPSSMTMMMMTMPSSSLIIVTLLLVLLF